MYILSLQWKESRAPLARPSTTPYLGNRERAVAREYYREPGTEMSDISFS